MRKINEIILHCSATREKQDIKTSTIKQWHLKQGWSDIGYHYVIELDGSIHFGRPENVIGAHCKGHNSFSIGICYVGGLDEKGNSKDTRTEAQKQSMYKLVKELMGRFNLSIDKIHCHNEYAKKDCPCFKIDTFRKELEEYNKK